MKINLTELFTILIVCTLTACQSQEDPKNAPTPVEVLLTTESPIPTETLTTTPEPPRVLTICSLEPASLFYYGDTSSAARSVLQAVYDGPIDLANFQARPVILEKIPSISDGDAYLQPVEVVSGTLVIDAAGNWVSLSEGVLYLPSGCAGTDCAQVYEGTAPVMMDALVLQFRLIPGLLWSDGTPLTASDSVYSFSVLEDLYRDAGAEMVRYTKTYRAIDDRTVEWVGIPGYRGNFATKFASPLPEHQLGALTSAELLNDERTSRTPLGWGPYVIQEWIAGDHLTLDRNPNYYRASEGLPRFDHLVFRFMENGTEAIDALIIGECDFIDRTILTEADLDRLEEEQEAGKLSFAVQTGTAWELAVFGINTLSPRYDWFGSEEVRQAITWCIDRQLIVDQLLYGVSLVPDTYVPKNHPSFEPVASYSHDPETAAELLTSAGWIDLDSDPQTPRTSAGIDGIPDGTPLKFIYLFPEDAERPETAEMLQGMLAACGIEVQIQPQNWGTLMASGPEGLLFGRKFEMAQFAWSLSIEPDCRLFTSEEIPGPYPEYPKGWGGTNLSGYSNPDFDNACQRAAQSLPGTQAYASAHQIAQEIFANDLPAIPLYQRIRLAAMRPDMCNAVIDPAANSALNHLEAWDYGDFCD